MMTKEEVTEIKILVDRTRRLQEDNKKYKKRIIYLESLIERLNLTLQHDLELIQDTLGIEKE